LASRRPHPEHRDVRGRHVPARQRRHVQHGLRYDHSQAEYQSLPILDQNANATGQFAPGNSDVYHWNVVSPRIARREGRSVGRTVVKGYYGLLYRGIFINDFSAAVPSITPKYYFDITTDWHAHQLRCRQQQFEPDDRSELQRSVLA